MEVGAPLQGMIDASQVKDAPEKRHYQLSLQIRERTRETREQPIVQDLVHGFAERILVLGIVAGDTMQDEDVPKRPPRLLQDATFLLVLGLPVLEVCDLRERLEGALLGAGPLLEQTARLSESLATAYRFGLRQGVKGVLRLDGRLL